MILRRWLYPSLLLPPGGWLLALYLIPLGIVVAISFGATDVLGNPIFGWHPSNYKVVVQHASVTPFVHSMVFAAAATAISLLIGYPAAYTIARYGGRVRHVLLGLVLLPWFVDYLVRIYAWIVLFGDEGLVNHVLSSIGITGSPPITFISTKGAVIAGLVYSYFPFMVLALYAAIERIPGAIIEAGRDLYGTSWQTFRHVTWPASFQGVIAGCALVFLPAAGDFANAQLLGGTSTQMIGNLIQDQFTDGYAPYGAVMALILILLLGIVMVYYVRNSARTARVTV